MDASGKFYPLARDMKEGFLHMAEEASGIVKVDHHQTQLSKDLVPCFRWVGWCLRFP